ncbi:hypothetical protein LA02_591 [Francisella philomiragia]|uniref:hypothetical protein n=1 Tax=Francisella philomiragia TaxID=28110 RepID=UPI0005A563A2|nr:hypothetical protein [Francisella philomiragia]AJI55990.1 hypothetical protein LA56_1483 [Francisella philomiragia]AJI57463.1 hypothetical protein LA02_591 [Francisella philomiragia]MBK2253023.1 hypothetical protein [Francisella philomiragia]MBK2296544.1 hypothetical protein [Francisella philomiragia]MBK2341011.1 hypothetical protein [Francisella philomiragia]
MKKYSVIVLSILLIGCSSNPKITEVGPGVIVSEKQLLTKEQIKKQDTKDDVLTGTGVGAGSGAVVGAGVGAFGGAMLGGMFGIIGGGLCTIVTLGLGAAPCFAATVGGGIAVGAAVGAGSGAVIGAGTGGLVGAGGSYIYASTKDVDKIKGKYQFEVLEDGKSSPITFEQFTDVEYASGDKVDIYQSEYKDVKTYFIKQLDQDNNEDAKIEKD